MLGKEEVVVKPLAGEFDAVGGISGATILGDGTVALILDAEGIIRQATRRTGQLAAAVEDPSSLEALKNSTSPS